MSYLKREYSPLGTVQLFICASNVLDNGFLNAYVLHKILKNENFFEDLFSFIPNNNLASKLREYVVDAKDCRENWNVFDQTLILGVMLREYLKLNNNDLPQDSLIKYNNKWDCFTLEQPVFGDLAYSYAKYAQKYEKRAKTSDLSSEEFLLEHIAKSKKIQSPRFGYALLEAFKQFFIAIIKIFVSIFGISTNDNKNRSNCRPAG